MLHYEALSISTHSSLRAYDAMDEIQLNQVTLALPWSPSIKLLSCQAPLGPKFNCFFVFLL
jgi:hypothetical protein